MKKSRISSLFTGSGSFVNTSNNEYDVLIVDEAHRLNAKSGIFSNKGENQIMEIIQSSQFSIFFIDEHQRIHMKDIGKEETIVHYGLLVLMGVVVVVFFLFQGFGDPARLVLGQSGDSTTISNINTTSCCCNL